MVFKQLGDSFKAFNQNALNALLYIMTKNVWFILIAICALVSMIMMLKHEIDYSVNEEQNII